MPCVVRSGVIQRNDIPTSCPTVEPYKGFTNVSRRAVLRRIDGLYADPVSPPGGVSTNEVPLLTTAIAGTVIRSYY
jgi:hypothetical protein